LPFWVFIKRCGLLITCGNRDRNNLKLKQAPFRERVQWATATLISTICEHSVHELKNKSKIRLFAAPRTDEKLQLKPYFTNTV
jgi:hypothetical protein